MSPQSLNDNPISNFSYYRTSIFPLAIPPEARNNKVIREIPGYVDSCMNALEECMGKFHAATSDCVLPTLGEHYSDVALYVTWEMCMYVLGIIAEVVK